LPRKTVERKDPPVTTSSQSSSSQPDLTRRTTAEEQKNIVGIDLDGGDVDKFMEMFRKGLVSATALHEAAVQNNMALSVEATVRIGRPVREDDGTIGEIVGREVVSGRIEATKRYADDSGQSQS